ncbi:unnamed protein product [Rotaria sordida]|uniref:Uncharacterized protein n=1 Tax=Rotaria sordida TaxID=392033 RepID=A0A815BD98_9BILA|nr:unnamed protein product [Rotaria sordida]CAF1268141.1 unnamed protein product [Rotaria sordida]
MDPTKLLSIYKNVKSVYDFLKKFNDNDLQMNGQWPTAPNRTVLFVANDSAISNFTSAGQPKYCTDKNHMEMFKEIAIICNHKDLFKLIITKFREEDPISQKDIISYLKYICEQFPDEYILSMDITCLEEKNVFLPTYNRFRPPSMVEVMILKLTITVD